MPRYLTSKPKIMKKQICMQIGVYQSFFRKIGFELVISLL